MCNRVSFLHWLRWFVSVFFLAAILWPTLDATARELTVDSDYARLEKLIRDTPVSTMSETWLIDQVYKGFDNPQTHLKQILGDSKLQDKNAHMARLRQAIDLKFWSAVAKQEGWVIELTNQGKTKGHRSDLDQTGWIIAGPEANRPANFEQVQGMWESHFSKLGIDPSKPDMTIFNGDQFMPDWANVKTGTAEFVVSLADNVLQLRQNSEAYYVPGANKEQVHTRALAEGRTMHVAWDFGLDMPVVNGRPLDIDAFVSGKETIHYLRTEDISARYRGVGAAKPWRNALGNLTQNLHEYLAHLDDPLSRQKYGNRVLDGAFARIIGVSQTSASLGGIKGYYAVHTSDATPEAKRAYKQHFIRQMYGGGDPEALGRNRVDELIQIYDVSVQVEADKAANQEYSAEKYYAPWLQEAAAELRRSNPELGGEELRRQSWSKAEQIYVQKQLSAIVGGASHVLKHALENDLTPEGRKRHRADYGSDAATYKQNVRKVLAERKIEIAMLFEVAEQVQDPELRKTLRNDLLDAAPDPKIRKMLQDLDSLAQSGRQSVDDWLSASKKRGKLAPPDEFYRKIGGDVEKIVGSNLEEAAAQTSSDRTKQWMDQKAFLLLGPLEAGRLSKAHEFMLEASTQGAAFKSHYWKEFLDGFNFFFYANTTTGLIKAYEDQCLKTGTGGSACGSAIAWEMAKDFTLGLPYVDSYGGAIFALKQINEGDASGFLTLPLSLASRVGVGASALHVYAVYKLTEAAYDITYGYIMYTIEEDILDQALKALPEAGKNAKHCGPRRGVGGGDTPEFPLFYKDIPVDSNNWDVAQRRKEARTRFAVPITQELMREGYDPLFLRKWEVARMAKERKYACLLPYYDRINKIYEIYGPDINRDIEESVQSRGKKQFDDASTEHMGVCVDRERRTTDKKRKAAESKGKDALKDYEEEAAEQASPIAKCLPRAVEKASPLVKAFFEKKVVDWLKQQPSFYQSAFSTTVEQTTAGIPIAEDLRGAYEWVGSKFGIDTRNTRDRLMQTLIDTVVREYVLKQYLYYESEDDSWELDQKIRGAAAMVSQAETLMRAIQTGNDQISEQVFDTMVDAAAKNFTQPVETIKPTIDLTLPQHPVELGQDALVDASVRGEYFTGGVASPANNWTVNLKTMPLREVDEGAPKGLIVTEELAKRMKDKTNAIFTLRQTVVAELVDKQGKVLGSEKGEIVWYDVRPKLGEDKEDEQDEDSTPDKSGIVLSGLLAEMRAAQASAVGATSEASAACKDAKKLLADVEQSLPGMEGELESLRSTLDVWRPAIAQLNALGDKAGQLVGEAQKAATRAREFQQQSAEQVRSACGRLREISSATESQRHQILASIVAAVQTCKANVSIIDQAAQEAKGAAAACASLEASLDSLTPSKPLPASDANQLLTATVDGSGKLDTASATAGVAIIRIDTARGFRGTAVEINSRASTLVADLENSPGLAAQLAEMSAIVSGIDQVIAEVEACPDDVLATAAAVGSRQDALRSGIEGATAELSRFDASVKNDTHRSRIREGVEQSRNYAEIAGWSQQGMQEALVSAATCQAAAEHLIAQAAETADPADTADDDASLFSVAGAEDVTDESLFSVAGAEDVSDESLFSVAGAEEVEDTSQAASSSVDCSGIPGSIAVQGQCICTDGLIYSASRSACIACSEYLARVRSLSAQGAFDAAQAVINEASACTSYVAQMQAVIDNARQLQACAVIAANLRAACQNGNAPVANGFMAQAIENNCQIDGNLWGWGNSLIAQYNQEIEEAAAAANRQAQVDAQQASNRAGDQTSWLDVATMVVQGMQGVVDAREEQERSSVGSTAQPSSQIRLPDTGTLPPMWTSQGSSYPGSKDWASKAGLDWDKDSKKSQSQSNTSTGTSGASSTGADQAQSTSSGESLTGGGMTASACELKFCPICTNSDAGFGLLGVTISPQCNPCLARYKAKIAACEQGDSAAGGHDKSDSQFQTYSLLECSRPSRDSKGITVGYYITYSISGPNQKAPTGERCSPILKGTWAQCKDEKAKYNSTYRSIN